MRFPLGRAVLCLVLAATASAKPIPLAVQEQGAGAPAIVLVHSIGGDHSDWNAVVPELAARHRVLVVDLPGHGQSPAPEGQPTVERTAAALTKTLSERKVDRAVLVGHSYGGLVALRAALDQPKRVLAVVTVEAPTYTPADADRLVQMDTYLRDRYSAFVSAVYETMSNDPALSESLIVRASRVEPAILSDYFRDSWREDLRPAIRKLKVALHVVATPSLWPDAESWTSARRRLGYETAGPAQGHRVRSSGHVVAMDQPDTLVAIIESVVASESAAKSK